MTATATDPGSAAGYRARFTSVDLGFPLFVVPHVKKIQRRLGKSEVEVNTLFGHFAGDINMDHAHPLTYLIVKARNEVKGDGWVKMGENPFGPFDTYIHVDHYDAYMKSLEILNSFPDKILARKDAHRVSKTSPRDVRKLGTWLTANFLPMPEKIPQDGQLLYRSSDIPGNLVLGTSETNSVMSREEKELAAAYHFLAYTISYSIGFPQGSKLLKMRPGTSLETTFYPFLRPVYHKLEDELDQALYGEIKNRDQNNVGQSQGVLPSPARSLGPYNQDGSDIYAGNAPYGDLMGLQQNAASVPEVQFQTAIRYGINPHNYGDGSNHEEKEKIKKKVKN
ncbi:hypothetical protein ACHAPY_010959 [Fusarium culmorum]|uniref:Uncharacterized protein n=1 Tax=Fusarium culmorum TaxID=5516 RepID=A0A2T4GF59_FUSCU|nr:hypothetical protein FCULG_00012232 [Fusarium culmorum]